MEPHQCCKVSTKLNVNQVFDIFSQPSVLVIRKVKEYDLLHWNETKLASNLLATQTLP